jgi:hypothetical protein
VQARLWVLCYLSGSYRIVANVISGEAYSGSCSGGNLRCSVRILGYEESVCGVCVFVDLETNQLLHETEEGNVVMDTSNSYNRRLAEELNGALSFYENVCGSGNGLVFVCND